MPSPSNNSKTPPPPTNPQDIRDEKAIRKQTEWLDDIIRTARQNRFYGKIIMVFQDGKLQHVENQRVIKPPTLED